jgi:hypothetical protein
MRAHPLARLVLIAGAGAVALTRGGESLALAATAIAVGYLMLLQPGLMLRYVATVAPFVAVSAALWAYVLIDIRSPDLVGVAHELVDPGSRFFLLLKMFVSTAVIVLALGSVPDGEFYPVLRGMGLPNSVALVFASGLALALTVRDSFERSSVALRAQGILGPTFRSKLAALNKLVALTWVSTLSTSIGRAEVKWSGNRFLTALREGAVGAPTARLWDTTVCLLLTVGLVSLALNHWTYEDVIRLI